MVEDADTVTVRMLDRREFEAEIVGLDPRSDLALLRIDGLDRAAYLEEFGSDLFEDFVHLSELEENGLAVRLDDRLTLTAAGMARSDTIGPWLYSEAVEVERSWSIPASERSSARSC